MPLKVVWRNGFAHIHGTVAGERVRESAHTCDPENAERVRVETEARLVRAALYGAENEATFADACALYLEEGGSNRYVTPILKALGKRRLATIKPGDIKSLARKIYPDVKNSTLNRCVVKPARAIINFGADRGLCMSMQVKGFKEAKVLRSASDRAWIDAFMAHAVNPYIRVVALFDWVTAARIGEACRLEPHHFDLDAKIATLQVTKTGDPRVYYLTDELVRELRLLPPRRTHFGRGPLKVFGYADKHGVYEPWKETCRRAGIKYLPPHQAGRHGFGTERIVRQQKDPVTTAALGGWSDPRVLLKTYAHAENLGEEAEASFGTRVTHAKIRNRKNRIKSVG